VVPAVFGWRGRINTNPERERRGSKITRRKAASLTLRVRKKRMKNKIKIAHVSTVDASLHGLLLNQMKSQQAAGYEVVGVSSKGNYVPLLEEAGIKHHAVEMSRNMTPGADAQSLSRLFRLMRREKFTIVHTHTPKAGLLGQLAARMARVPIVINTLHGFYFHDHMAAHWRKVFIATETIAARCSDSILSQNKEDIATAIREKICKPEKIHHLGNGIDLTQFDPALFSRPGLLQKREELGIAEDAPVIGFVGRLAARRKGFTDFLKMAQIVSRENPAARFLVVGDADKGKPDAVEPETAKDFGVYEKCVFVGHRPNDELPLLHAVMDVIVLPSLFEGVPRAIMEACAMSTPAVVTDVKGNREAVRENYNGHLVPLGDYQALAAAILSILNDPQKAKTMSENARAFALENFDETKVFQKVLDEYARLLKAKSL
jgi:glycosyltransferase involved in cell wall biosynthesis